MRVRNSLLKQPECNVSRIFERIEDFLLCPGAKERVRQMLVRDE